MPGASYIPYREIPSALGIAGGDTLLLTSDILRLAAKAIKNEKEFSADDFINAFLDALGPEGTLLIPAYNFDLESGDRYSVRRTEPMTGALAVAALRRGDFARTAHPLHSFLVKGKFARELVAMTNVSSFGKDSPFDFLFRQDALMVFAGTGIAEAMTFTHFVEESLSVKYRRFRIVDIHYTDDEGHSEKRKYRIYAKKTGYTMRLQALEKLMPENINIKTMINGIPFSKIRCRDAFDLISRDISENNAASIAVFDPKLYFRDIIKGALQRFTLFRTTYGKIRSGKRIS